MLVGIVGKPSSGKSTIFRAMTLVEVDVAPHPFTTIKPNHGVGYVKMKCPCKELGVECDPQNSFCINGWRFAAVELLDVAGLVPGAHEGRGLGNQFLDDLRQADAFIHVLDISGTTDEEGRATTGYDVTKDVKFLEDEIDFWFRNILKKYWSNIVKSTFGDRDKMILELVDKLSGLGIRKIHIQRVMDEFRDEKKWEDDKLLEFASALRRISKPMIIACNKADMPDAKTNFGKFKDHPAIATCAEAEYALKLAAEKDLINYTPGNPGFEILKEESLDEKQKKGLEFVRKYLSEWGSTGVQQVLDRAVFDLLKCIVVFPVEDENKLTNKDGHKLPDALIMPPNSTALDMAYKIHSDIGDSFIRAIDCKTKRIVGKEYKLKNGDVIKIVSRK
jgi:ribosome-binding ATPase YchF (GTP1/OBG family)